MDSQTEAISAEPAEYLAGDALASALLGLQDQLFTGAVSLHSIDGVGFITLLFGGVVSARYGDLTGGEAVMALLSGPPAAMTVSTGFDFPVGVEAEAHSTVLSDVVDRWRLTNQAAESPLGLDDLASADIEPPTEPEAHPREVPPLADASDDAEMPVPLVDELELATPETLPEVARRGARAFKPTEDQDPDLEDPLAFALAFGDDGPPPSNGQPPPGSPHEALPGDLNADGALPPVLTSSERCFLPLPAGLAHQDGSGTCPSEFISGDAVRSWVERHRFTGVLSFGVPETLRLYIVGGRVLGVEAIRSGNFVLGAAGAHVGTNAMAGRPVVALHYERGLALALSALASDYCPVQDGVRSVSRCADVPCESVLDAHPVLLAAVVLSAGEARMLAWRMPGGEWCAAAAGGARVTDVGELQALWGFPDATVSIQHLDPATLRPLFVSSLPD